jgi:hypothetical protein
MAGNGVDAAIWGPEAGGTSFYNPTNNFGLGNASPWRSTPGLGGPGGGVYGGGGAGGMIFSFAEAGGEDVGFWEGLIPIWGSGKQSYHDFKRGCTVGGIVNGALAISDVFLVKAAAESVGKGAIKTGSHTWSATRKWYGATRDLASGQPVHHWLVPQGGWGKSVPNAIKNQPWNLMPISPPAGLSSAEWHQAIHGVGNYALGTLGSLWYGTPAWGKNAAANIGARISQLSNFVTCGGSK